MKQATLPLDLSAKKTRKQMFLDQMDQVVPWAALVELIAPYYPEGMTGRPPFSLMTMLRTHFMQEWFSLSDPAMEEAFFDTQLYREFAQLQEFGRLPDESTIFRFIHRLEKDKLSEQILQTVNEILTQRGLLLKVGTAVDATLIAAPTSTKKKDKARDPEMHSSKKSNQWYFGMKAHIGVDAESGLVYSVRGTSGHVSEIAEGNSLLHGQERFVALATQATEASKSAQMLGLMSSSTSPCGRASAKSSIRATKPTPCLIKQKSSKQVDGPKWSTRFESSSASSDL